MSDSYKIQDMYSKSIANNFRDFENYPEVIPHNKFAKLHRSSFISLQNTTPFDNGGVNVSADFDYYISNSAHLIWDNPPKRNYDQASFDAFDKNNDLEFKNIFLICKIKEMKYPNQPISKEVFNLLMLNYMNNLVFTRWLYKDFIEFKQYVTSQKKQKRDNYKNNLRNRSKVELQNDE